MRLWIDHLRLALKSRLWLPAWALIGTLMRLALVWRVGGKLAFADEHEYDYLGVALSQGAGYVYENTPTAFRPPGQAFFLAEVYSIAGHRPIVAECVQAILLAYVPFAVAKLGQLVMRRGAGPQIAGALAAMHPGLAYASATLYPTAITTVALLCGIVLAAFAFESEGKLRTALSAVALGFAGLCTTYFAVLPLLVGAILARRRRFTCAAIMVAVGMLPAAAWAVRNELSMGAAALSTSAGFNLELGANDEATPRSGNWVNLPWDNHEDEVSLSRTRANRAVAWIEAHPVRWGLLFVGRAAATLDSVGAPRTPGAHDGIAAKIVGIFMAPWVVFGVFGLWRFRSHPAALLSAAALAVVVLASACTLAKPRFRFPVDPLLAVFAVAAAQRKLHRRRGRSVCKELGKAWVKHQA